MVARPYDGQNIPRPQDPDPEVHPLLALVVSLDLAALFGLLIDWAPAGLVFAVLLELFKSTKLRTRT
ncbi:hypothetical protein AB0M12_07680 [Nocardia vinacea]|uniref:hypothetical protein n=1 Tax=Nocardia vinacea TaxID=96468 RepID=UPI003435A34C